MESIDTVKICGDRVLVKQLKYDDKIGSFYVPDNVVERKAKRRSDAWRAEVVTVGNGVVFEDGHNKFAKGDIVYCAPVSLDCPAFEMNGEKYIVLLQEDLLAVEVK